MSMNVSCGGKRAAMWLLSAMMLVCLVMVLPVAAEKPTFATPQTSGTIIPTELTPTPEMWFYEQYMLQRQDPKSAVQQKAQYRTQQRQRLLATRKWLGISTARPVVHVDPFHGGSWYWFWR